MNNDYLKVSDINNIIKSVIDNNPLLQKVYIKGEISNLKYHTRGHLYFSLKDEASKINAVMFNYNNMGLNFTPKDGDSVLVKGRISVYPASGSYQVYVESMEMDGTGNLYVLFEELKKKLSSEGLFSEEHKKKIVKMPRKVGIITASTGAAIKDIISTINSRFPLVELIIFPTLVQGEDAKNNIVKMIKLANTYDLDTIILGRGGGSIEDLWAFNEEIVARAIYESNIPIISAVGHEIDFTISDFVADARAATPTAAGMMCVPDKYEIIRYLNNAEIRLDNSLNNKLDAMKLQLDKYKHHYIINNPTVLYEMKEQKLDSLIDKLRSNMKEILDNSKFEFNTIKLKLDLLNPLNILDKGYSIVLKDNEIVKDINNIKKDDKVDIMVKNGKLKANITEVKKK